MKVFLLFFLPHQNFLGEKVRNIEHRFFLSRSECEYEIVFSYNKEIITPLTA